jgi:uncharacterized membrane protein
VTANPLAVAACAAVALGMVLRVFARADLPLWLDEAWTGAIIAQTSIAGVIDQALLDANAPLYFVLMHFWSVAFGLSNGVLRFPALAFGAVTPLLALIAVKAIGRDARLVWCGLMALWIPGLWYSQEARCYSLLLCLTMGCTIAYARLLAAPDRRRAAVWALLGAASILTHYHALILVGCQGLAYLAVHRTRAVRTWPAALVFLPALAWAGLHLPQVARFTDPQAAWFSRLGLGDIVPVIISFLLGNFAVAVGLVCIVLVALIVRTPDDHETGPVEATQSALDYAWVVVATAAFAASITLAMGMLSPTFTSRYLMPFVPGLLLGLSLGVCRLARRSRPAPLMLILVFAVAAVQWAAEGRGRTMKTYNFETASNALMNAGADRLAFLWDNPIAQLCDPGQLAAVGGFFFRRAGRPIPVESISVHRGEDPNARLLAAAAERHTAIMWLYDLEVSGTAARSYSPRIDKLDPAWRCRQFGKEEIGVVACLRAELPM